MSLDKLLSGMLAASVSGAIMIVALIVLRMLFQNWTPRRLFCLLWDLVLARLLIPYALPSPVSVWQSSAAPATVSLPGNAVTVPSGVGATAVTAADGTVAAAAPAVISTGTFFAAVWLMTALAMAAWFIINHLCARRSYADSLPCGAAFALDWLAAHPLRRAIRIRTSDRASAPLTYGVLRPVILLPSGTDQESERALSWVLEHEYQHIRRFDTLRKGLLAAALCLHCLNPLVWVMYALCSRDMELLCDEAVTRSGADRADYARTLLSMEERRSRWSLANHFNQNALEERIRSIMNVKKKHISIAALVAVIVIMGVTTTVFASAAPVSRETATDDLQVEWWTSEEYAAWLEDEKIALQGMIDERAYTGGEGWFTWDQARVDKAIAMYEGILEDIQNGALYSKTVTDKNGGVLKDVMLGSGTLNHSDITIAEDEMALLEELKCFGIGDSADELSYNGRLIRLLVDGVPVGDNGYSIGYVYSNPDGVVDVHTVRSVRYNSDGSYNPMGDLIGVTAEDEPGFDRKLVDCAGFSGVESVVAEAVITDADLEPYRRFGLDYKLTGGELQMSLNGTPVHSLYDTASGTWFANNLHGSELGTDAVDLETVYHDEMLIGLAESKPPHNVTHAVYAEGSGDPCGMPFEEIFAPYAVYGLLYSPGDGGLGSLSLNGQAVKLFADSKPDGGEFSYSDPNMETGLRVYTEYDMEGNLSGLYTR